MRVGFIAWIAALARCIPLLMALWMPGLASAQGTPEAPTGAPGLGPQNCYWRGTTADIIISACTVQLRKGRPPRRRRSRQQRSGSSPGALRVGQPIRIRWTTPAGRRDAAKPTYLIVATPAAVRFAGSGFFALGPDAEGPA